MQQRRSRPICIVLDTTAVKINEIGSPVERVCAIVEFWCTALFQGSSCPYKSWIKLAHFFMLFQPSSASAERAFSILKRLLERGGMDKAKHDLVEGTMMTWYNAPGKFDCNVYKKARANARALVAAQAEVVDIDGEVSDNGSDNGENFEHNDF